MIPLPVFWREYTTTKQGRVVKIVSCESCSSEYVYLMERESSGVGTSLYLLNNEGAEEHSQSAAAETLKSVLENDFDPVPCPVCGHYQQFMFPKLLETKRMSELAIKFALIMAGGIAAVIAVRESIAYLRHPNDSDLKSMVAAGLVFLSVGAIGLGLSIVNRFKAQHFNPNLGDPQARIAIARNRAITRAEFEKIQQEKEQG
jgi:hypothetical protein